MQNGVQGLAGGFDGRDVAAFKRRKQGASGGVEGGQNRESEGADQETEWIEPAESRRAEECGDQAGDQHHIFAGLPALVAIGLQTPLATLGLRRHIADKVLQRAHGTDPAAKKAAQKERGHEDDQAPDESAIERMTGQCVEQGHQRVPFEKEPHRRAEMNFGCAGGKDAHRSEEQQREKEQQKKDLRDPAQQRQSGLGHDSSPRRRARGF